jgi:hypothetical protein
VYAVSHGDGPATSRFALGPFFWAQVVTKPPATRAAIMRGYLNLEPLAWTYLQRQFLWAVREGVMVTNKHGATVKTAIEARPCPSVIARITVTTCVAVVILGVWFAFFQA